MTEETRTGASRPNETDLAIFWQGVADPRHKIEQAKSLVGIRAFSDAQRVLRSASNDLLALADQLEADRG